MTFDQPSEARHISEAIWIALVHRFASSKPDEVKRLVMVEGAVARDVIRKCLMDWEGSKSD